MTALRHQLKEDGRVLVTVVGERPFSGYVTESEAKRFAWSLLADLDPDAIEDEAVYVPDSAAKLALALKIPPMQAKVLVTLYAHEGVVRRRNLAEAIETNAADLKVLDVYLSKLRKRFGEGVIQTLHAKGVRLSLAGRALVREALERAT